MTTPMTIDPNSAHYLGVLRESNTRSILCFSARDDDQMTDDDTDDQRDRPIRSIGPSVASAGSAPGSVPGSAPGSVSARPAAEESLDDDKMPRY